MYVSNNYMKYIKVKFRFIYVFSIGLQRKNTDGTILNTY